MCTYDDKYELVDYCEDVKCKGPIPLCGHNHHTPHSKAWKRHAMGFTWELPDEDEDTTGETLEEHIASLIAQSNLCRDIDGNPRSGGIVY